MVEQKMDRRRFLALVTTTIGAAVLAGCIRKEGIEAIQELAQATSTPSAVETSASAVAAPTQAATAAPSPTAAVQAVPQKQGRSACPKGLVDDPYPGRCRRYVDNDGNGYCDLSEV